jgi:thiosulfate/3-mercaptopyruvate sulfurtransferase
VPVSESKSFPINEVGTSLILTKEDMLNALEKDNIVILDVRDIDEWIGVSSSPYGIDFLSAQRTYSWCSLA